MRKDSIKVGRVYRWNGSGELVRVLRYGGGDCWTVKGPRKTDVPYNHAYHYDMHEPTYLELQKFLQLMP